MSLYSDCRHYWKLDETSGNAADSHGSETLTATSITYNTDGILGKCFYFENTTADRLDSGNNIDFASGEPWSIQFWFYPKDTALQIIHEKTGATSTVRVYTESGTSKLKAVLTSNNAETCTIIQSNTWSTNAWHHCVLTFDGLKTATLYVDNTNVGSASTTNNTGGFTGEILQLGQEQNYNSAFTYNGYLDEIGYWDVELTSAQVSELYNGGSGLAYPFASAPVAAFSADVTTGQVPLTVTFTDSSTGSPTSWSWDFGDSDTSALQNPEHIYTAVGSFTVTLTATNVAGSDDEVKVDYITTIEAAGTSSDPTKTKGTAEVATRYPVTSGLTARTTKQEGRQSNLVPSGLHGKTSNVYSNDRTGL